MGGVWERGRDGGGGERKRWVRGMEGGKREEERKRWVRGMEGEGGKEGKRERE